MNERDDFCRVREGEHICGLANVLAVTKPSGRPCELQFDPVYTANEGEDLIGGTDLGKFLRLDRVGSRSTSEKKLWQQQDYR